MEQVRLLFLVGLEHLPAFGGASRERCFLERGGCGLCWAPSGGFPLGTAVKMMEAGRTALSSEVKVQKEHGFASCCLPHPCVSGVGRPGERLCEGVWPGEGAGLLWDCECLLPRAY